MRAVQERPETASTRPVDRDQGCVLAGADSAPRSELQQRLAAKVAALREARHAEERAAQVAAARSFRARKGAPTGIRTRTRARTHGRKHTTVVLVSSG